MGQQHKKKDLGLFAVEEVCLVQTATFGVFQLNQQNKKIGYSRINWLRCQKKITHTTLCVGSVPGECKVMTFAILTMSKNLQNPTENVITGTQNVPTRIVRLRTIGMKRQQITNQQKRKYQNH